MTTLDLTAVQLLTALASASLKSTVILAVAALAARLLRHRTATLRHLVWTAALGSTVAILVLPLVLPAWRVIPIPAVSLTTNPPLVSAAMAAPSIEKGEPSDAPSPGLGGNGGNAPTYPLPRPRAIQGPRHAATPAMAAVGSWPVWLFGIWMIGALGVVARYAWGRMALHRLARSSTLDAESTVLVQQTAQRMRIGRPVSLRNSDRVEMPMTWGVFRPQVVLPAAAIDWTPECRHRVLQHELAHIQRLDAGTQLVAQAAATIFWFHPLVWYAVGRMRCERERACDDQVLTAGAVAADYASDLLALVTTSGSIEGHAAALAFARRSQLEGRLVALLDPNVDRGVLSQRRVILVLSLAGLAILPLAAAQRVDAHGVHSGTAPAPTVSMATRSISPAVPSPYPLGTLAPGAPMARSRPDQVDADSGTNDIPTIVEQAAADPQDLFAACSRRAWSNHSDAEHSGAYGTWTASGQTSDCRFELSSVGTVQFDRETAAIESISPGGVIDMTTSIRGDVTQLVVRASATGDLGYEFTRNGQRVDYGSDGTTWLAQFLLALDRTNAFAIEQRLPLLLQTGGPAAVLAEIDRMHTDYARRSYLLRLMQSAPLDAGQLWLAANTTASISAPHDVAELIVALTGRYALPDSASRGVLLRRALALRNDDHDQVESLLGIIRRTALTHDETFAVLSKVPSMQGDYEKSRLLIPLVAGRALDGELKNAAVAAAESIGDARERARVLNMVGRAR